MSEGALVKRLLVRLSEIGARAFRNNVGQWKDRKGHIIRYGVCNPGGSDILGWVPMEIRPEHVGQTVAVFLAVEAKVAPNTPTEAQRNFVEVVNRMGGIAIVGYSEEEVEEVVRARAGL